MRIKGLFLFICLLFAFSFSSVNASYKASSFTGECTTVSIPFSATSIYEVDDGVFNLSGATYGNYVTMHEDDDTNKGYSNYLLDNNYVYYSTVKDKKTLIAYVPNYRNVVKDKEAVDILKAQGLYDEKALNCSSTYVAKATVVFYEDKDDIDSDNDSFKNEVKSFLSLKNILILLVAICFILIFSLVLIKKSKLSKLKVYLIMAFLLLLTIGLLIISFKNSYAVTSSLNKVKNVKVISNTSTSSRIGFSKVDKASSYEVCYKESTVLSYSCRKTSGTSLVINKLNSNTYYNYKVRAVNNNALGPYSNVLTSKTYKKDGYYYSLNTNEQTVYNEIYQGVKARKKEVFVTPSLTVKNFSKVYHYVRSDHPELFYMDVGYYYYYDTAKKVACFDKYYNSTFKKYASNKKKFDRAVNAVVRKAKNYKTDYAKEQYVAYYLSKNVKYDYKAYDKYSKTNKWTNSMALTQSAYSALVTKKTFCAGYSSAFKYIMSELGVDSYVIGGVGRRFGSSGDHAWNLVKLDDGYYNVDVTWIRNKNGNINLTYFNQKKSSFNSAHIRDKDDKVAPASEGNLYLNFNGSNIINLKNNSGIVLKGKTKKLNIKVDKKYTRKSRLKYKSSNSNILKVNRIGRIKGIKPGTASIKVYTREGISSSKKFVVKNKVICEKIDREYYGKNGKRVSASAYYKQCNPKCIIKNNTYYNDVGKPVSRDSYYLVCSGKCVSSGSRYYDKNGNLVSKASFYKSCNPSCKKIGNVYYDKNGRPSSFEDYSISCYSDNGNFEITFDYLGKTTDTESIKAGTVLTKPKEPTKKGYNFVGWYEDENYIKEYDFSSSVYENVTLYAKWEKEMYTVKFDTNGGTYIPDSKVNYNEQVSKPFDPEKKNSVFAGWYSDDEFKSKYSFLTPVKNDITLYAKWDSEESNKVDVTFVPGHDHNPFVVEVEKGNIVYEPSIDSNDDLIFDDWYIDSNRTDKYDFESPVYEDIVLYGKWKTIFGEDIIEAPDTASKIKIVVIAVGILMILVGMYYLFKKYLK